MLNPCLTSSFLWWRKSLYNYMKWIGFVWRVSSGLPKIKFLLPVCQETCEWRTTRNIISRKTSQTVWDFQSLCCVHFLALRVYIHKYIYIYNYINISISLCTTAQWQSCLAISTKSVTQKPGRAPAPGIGMRCWENAASYFWETVRGTTVWVHKRKEGDYRRLNDSETLYDTNRWKETELSLHPHD